VKARGARCSLGSTDANKTISDRTEVVDEPLPPRTSRKRALERKRFKDKLRAAAYRSKMRQRNDYLPKRIREQEQRADELIKAAKGLGKR